MDFLQFASLCIIISVSSTVGFPRVSAVPTTLECPADSALMDGQCECDTSRCATPACDKVLNLAANGTATPGSCCPTYTCDLCPTEIIQAGRCSCATGAFINKYGKCKCADPEKSVMDGECVCDENKCPLDHICDENSVKVMEVKGCCKVAKCIRCPLDSHPYNGGEEIEDKCVCFPCSKPECLHDEIPVYKRRGTNFPSTCCDLYECTKPTCLVDGIAYSVNETWETETEKCRCVNGVAICQQPPQKQHFMSCPSGDKFYPHLSTWVEDSCTNCTCFDGEPKCISHMCDVNTSEICPPLDDCLHCEFGYELEQNKDNGCDVCKCKYTQLAKLLKEQNLSEMEVLQIVERYLGAEFNFSTSTKTTPTPEVYTFTLWILIIIVILTCAVLVFCFCYKNKRIYSAVERSFFGEMGTFSMEKKSHLELMEHYDRQPISTGKGQII